MTDKIIVWRYVDSCEACPVGIREQYGKFRCGENPEIVFQQNKDFGVPVLCPYRGNKPPCQ